MMKMSLASLFRSLALMVALLGMGSLPAPQPAQAQGALQPGRDFVPVNPPQPTEAAGKIEVLEFFSYACPHCADFDPPLSAWAKGVPRDVVIRRVPITFGRDQWVPLAKLYYSLEATGDLARLHPKVFDAIHKEKLNLADENIQFDWVAKQGMDRQKYIEIYKSFSIQSKMARAQQVAAAYKIRGVPSLAVDGKYMVTGDNASSHAQMLSLLDRVIAYARGDGAKKK